MPSTYAYLAIGVLSWLAYKISRSGRRSPSDPPGPPTVPFLGNTHLIPTEPTEKHVYYDKLAKTYGDVYSLKLFGKLMVIVNSAKATAELLDKRSASFNDRPDTYILDGHIAQGKHIVLTNGKKNALLRKIWNRTLAPTLLQGHAPVQHAEAVATCSRLLKHGEDFYEELQRYPCSVATIISYGKRAPTFRSVDKTGFSCKEFYRLDEDFLKLLEVGAVPMFDMIPVLQVLPGPWNAVKKDALRLKNETDEFFWKQYLEVKRRIAAGQRSGCWLESIIENNVDDLAEDMQSWQGGIMLSGASSTAANTLLTTVLACATHPAAVSRAQAELDSVIGQDRLPSLDDIDSLPYVKAFIREIMRWRPTAPGGSPHLTTQDESYNGHVIPKGSYIVGNTWGILHDPEFYDAPENFEPERFIKHEFGLKPSVQADYWRNTYAFGAGRRICIGLHFAENELFTMIPKLLHLFTFAPPTGTALDTSWAAYVQRGTLAAPKPYRCEIRIRSGALKATLEKENAEAEAFLRPYEPEL